MPVSEPLVATVVVTADAHARDHDTRYREIHDRGLHERPIHAALELSNNDGRLPVFSCDRRAFGGGVAAADAKHAGAKFFVVASYAAFWLRYAAMPPGERCFYEILLHEQPCHLYVDVDADRHLNTDIDEHRLLGALLDECVRLLIELGAVERAEEVRVVTLDASKPEKLSKHFVFHLGGAGSGVVFRNNYHCGAFVRRLRQRMLQSYGPDTASNAFFVRKLVKDRARTGHWLEVREFLADITVYTKRRNFRLYGSVKRKAPTRPLLLEGQADGDASLCKSTFLDCLVQRTAPDARLFECREQNGSTPRSITAVVAPAATASTRLAPVSAAEDIEALRAHYEHVYPFEAIYELFGGPHVRREFSFQWRDGRRRRYLFFDSAVDMRRAVLGELPAAVHIGPVYANSDAAAGRANAVRYRELTFDVDLDAYADVRACCGDRKRACARCWPYARFCVRTLTRFLRDDYGFDHVLFFFSGAKGLHCWVFDEEPRTWPHDARQALLDDLHVDELARGNASVLLPPPCKKRRYTRDVVAEHDEAYYRRLLIDEHGLGKQFARARERLGLHGAVRSMMWPRVDAAVTTQPNHLMKSPFAMHAGTRNVCYMLREDASDDPLRCPPSDDELRDNVARFAECVRRIVAQRRTCQQ